MFDFGIKEQWKFNATKGGIDITFDERTGEMDVSREVEVVGTTIKLRGDYWITVLINGDLQAMDTEAVLALRSYFKAYYTTKRGGVDGARDPRPDPIPYPAS